ncbi:MAG: 1-hydroxycarotenoid 3,4-desaturase CrtD [Spirochaetaceae bacterium]
MQKGRVGIVGAGLGGLAAALRLAASGWEVSVFEKQEGPGGKAFSEKLGGYRFDTGPSLLTLAAVFEELFSATGARLSDYLTVERLETICHYFYPDGTRLRSYGDMERFATELQEKTGEPRKHVLDYFAYSKRIHDITAELFLRRSLHDPATYWSKRFFSSLFQLGRIDPLKTMDEAHRRFFDSPKVRQLFNRYATYNGSSPYKTPATLAIIPYVEYGLGAYAVMEGMYAIPRAMEKRARELGVEFRYGRAVKRICTEDVQSGAGGRVTGLETAEGVHAFDVVISDADVKPTYRRLLQDPEAPLLKRYERLEPSSSGMVFYWGIKREFPELGLHNIFFSSEYEKEFSEIFEEGRSPTDPTVYINITSKVTPGDAPEGGENWFLLINVPPDRGQDWEAEAVRVRKRLLRRLSQELGTDVETLIEVEGRLLPPDIEARTDSHGGSLYGISSNTRRAAFLRHPNRSPRYKGLYHCGGSAHPGGGMPLVVLSAMISADLIERHEGKRPLLKAETVS